MNYTIKDRDQHLAKDGAPKRILALDGGGLRGILSLALLQKIEHILRGRHGGHADFRLCHYFDLMAGTSTGSIIAAALALGWSVEELRAKYMDLGEMVFKKSLLRNGLLRAKYDEAKLISELKKVYGAKTTVGGSELKTGLLVMTKRIDTGSPWPISNNPAGKYFSTKLKGVVGNGDYPLWQVVRASTAAPAFFDPESITIARVPGSKAMIGEFIDGGVSPFNNPALMSVMYATMAGYRVGWPTGADKLLVVSVGTGAPDPDVTHASVAAKQALNALLSLMNDSATLQETMMQWLSGSPTARPFDREVGDLQNDLVGGVPVLSYLRYNVDLRCESVQSLDPTLKDETITSLSAMDAPANMETLYHLGELAASRDIQSDHFQPVFDLGERMRETAMDRRVKYRRRLSQFVVAVRLDLETKGLSYQKWGGPQRAKRGDWLVDNDGDVYTVDGKVFARTYRRLRLGWYVKKTPVWAEVAAEAGSIKTKEGASQYRKGDYLVYNHPNGRDGYCMSATKFKALYVRDARHGK